MVVRVAPVPKRTLPALVRLLIVSLNPFRSKVAPPLTDTAEALAIRFAAPRRRVPPVTLVAPA